MNLELIEDFLNNEELKENDDILLGQQAVVNGWSIQGNSCFVEVEYILSGAYISISISLFDLLTFVYSKISVS